VTLAKIKRRKTMPEDKQNKTRLSGKVKARTAKRVSSPKSYCGMIMPISAIDGCNEQHWSDVREIIESSVTDAGFEPRLSELEKAIDLELKRIGALK